MSNTWSEWKTILKSDKSKRRLSINSHFNEWQSWCLLASSKCSDYVRNEVTALRLGKRCNLSHLCHITTRTIFICTHSCSKISYGSENIKSKIRVLAGWENHRGNAKRRITKDKATILALLILRSPRIREYARIRFHWKVSSLRSFVIIFPTNALMAFLNIRMSECGLLASLS